MREALEILMNLRNQVDALIRDLENLIEDEEVLEFQGLSEESSDSRDRRKVQ